MKTNIGAASADCGGQNLFEAMPEGRQAELEARAALHPFHEGLFWQATRDDQDIILVGTLHYSDPRFEPMIEALRPVLSSSVALLVEAGPEEEAQLQASLATLMFAKGATLPERLPEKDWQTLAAAMELRGFPVFMTSKMQPWFLSLMLAMPVCEMEELKSGDLGFDKRLILAADMEGVPLIALEPFDTLFQIFSDMTPEEELLGLRLALAQMGEAADMAETVEELYFAGRTRLIWEISAEKTFAAAPPGLPHADVEEQLAEAEDMLVTKRNKRWISVIEAAAEKGPVVVAAGALHMPGENGVLALLQGRGWRIEPYVVE